MGWQSSLLGSNVVSSYEHIDNLRNDLTAGKFWDNGETKYTKISHDGTDGVLDCSSGNLVFRIGGAAKFTLGATGSALATGLSVQNGKYVIAYNGDNTKYAYMYHNGTNAVFMATAGKTQLAGNANDHVQIGAGSAQSRIYMYDAGLAAWRYIYVNGGAVGVGT